MPDTPSRQHGGGKSTNGQPVIPEPSYAERARTLTHMSRIGSLSTLSQKHPDWPFGSMMPYGLDERGSPILLISTMAMHTKNILRDPRASLFVTQNDSAVDPLDNSRVTLMGKVLKVQGKEAEDTRKLYLSRYENSRYWVDFDDFGFFRMDIIDVYFVGGFGAMGWITAEEYYAAEADPLAEFAPGIIQHMNEDHADSLLLLAKVLGHVEADEARMTAVDRLGFHVRLKSGDRIHSIRIPFTREARSRQETRAVLVEMVGEARKRGKHRMIGKRISLYTALLFWALITSVVWAASVSEMADIMLSARRENKPIPVLSSRYPDLDVETAYGVQRAYNLQRLVGDNIAGFKAGLTGAESQNKFGVDSPVAGAIFVSGEKTGSPTINRSEFHMPMIETEIGFVVDKPIIKPLRSESAFYENIRAVIPVVELPELGFEDLNKVKAEDIIASNVGAAQFIVGDEKGLKDVNLNGVTVTLSLNGQVINRGKGSDALGDQIEAALWLINRMVNEGWKIEPGHTLITGVLGKMVPAKQGKYVADYGSLGKINFEIK